MVCVQHVSVCARVRVCVCVCASDCERDICAVVWLRAAAVCTAAVSVCAARVRVCQPQRLVSGREARH